MRFAELSKYLQELEKTTSRNKITEILGKLFGEAKKTEIDKICYLLLGRIAPQYTGIEFNLAEKMMIRAVAQAYEVEADAVVKEYKQVGDLGDVAHAIANSKLKSQKSKLTVNEVYEKLYKIATESGGGSQERKLSGMALLLKEIDSLSVKYVVRVPTGKLRLGFSDVTMLDALSVMEVGDKSERPKIEAVYNVTADIGKVAMIVKKKGVKHLKGAQAIPGIPIRPALAERLDSAEKIVEKVGPKVAVEGKLDGFRTQLHIYKEAGEKKIGIFSRNLENVTNMFPDIVEAAKKLSVQDAIFDGEAIGYNPKTGRFFPFQETVQRKRKYGILEMAAKIPLKVFIFDVLHLNGKTWMNEPFARRREVLEKTLKGTDTIVLAEQKIIEKPQELRRFFEECTKEGLEGVMAKRVDVPYQAGGRGFHWVKYKKHTGASLVSDTIDCVLMGAFKGRGKRAQFGVGGFLLGVRGKDDKYYTISNLGTGLTDEQFREMNKTVEKLKVSKPPKEYVVDKLSKPDIWVKPEIVLEILADEITISSRHTAGRDETGKGYSLRFPRLIKIRDDKAPGDATRVSEIEKLYKMQKK